MSTSTQSPIPIISWQEAMNWKLIQTKKIEITEKIFIDIIPDNNSSALFALKVNGDSMWPQFQDSSVLIIDSNKNIKNRDFVVVHLNNSNETIFRQLYIEGSRRILKAFNKDFPTIQMHDDDKIIGVIIQTRNEYD